MSDHDLFEALDSLFHRLRNQHALPGRKATRLEHDLMSTCPDVLDGIFDLG